MDERTIMLVLRLIHIVSGVFWVGAFLLMVGFLFPAVRATGPEGGRVIQEVMQRRRLPVYLGVAAGLTILSGFVMYARVAAATNGAWAETRPGMTYGLGGLAAILAVIIGAVVAGPAGRKLGRLAERVQASGGPPSAEQASQMAALQVRMGRGMQAVAFLLLVAVVAMAIARYL
ncbi:MAG: hypothetical protein M3282_06310 [Gemmatimonadota bacterium]|nr:hypothetical protein [Gemmatimonadota bacterium]